MIIRDALSIDALANTLYNILNTLSALALVTRLFTFYLKFKEPNYTVLYKTLCVFAKV